MGNEKKENIDRLPDTAGPKNKTLIIGLIVLIALCGGAMVAVPNIISGIVKKSVDSALEPVERTGEQIKTQVGEIIHPTPTIYVDPVTIIHEMRALSRLETIQYSVEKVITAESRDDEFGFLFGDQLLFVAHGVVIAGIDLNKEIQIDIQGENISIELPPAEVFITSLDNEKSYVYDRKVGILTKGDPNLETSARRAAEEAILNAALEDGILDLAQKNAENYLSSLLSGMGYDRVIFKILQSDAKDFD